MKFIKIDKKDWAAGLQWLSEAYRLIGPVKEEEFHNFKALGKGFPSKCHPLLLPPETVRFVNVTSELFKYPENSFVDVVWYATRYPFPFSNVVKTFPGFQFSQ